MKLQKIKTRAFTLIELLIVIAIIGILSSVVLASLNSARDKAANSVVKSSMASLRSQAEIFYDTLQSYLGVCSDPKFLSMLEKATTTGGGPTTTASTYCVDEIDSWSAYSHLKVSEDSKGYWCADNKGMSGLTDVSGTWATTSCSN